MCAAIATENIKSTHRRRRSIYRTIFYRFLSIKLADIRMNLTCTVYTSSCLSGKCLWLPRALRYYLLDWVKIDQYHFENYSGRLSNWH